MKQRLKKGISIFATIALFFSSTSIGNITAYAWSGADLRVNVTKDTAESELEKAYDWKIDKTVDEDTWDLSAGQSGTSTYTITVVKSEKMYRFVVEGDIIIENKGDSPAFNVKVDAALRSTNGSTRYESTGSLVTGGPTNGILMPSTPGNKIKYTYHYVLYYDNTIDPTTLGVLKVDAIITGNNIFKISPDISSAAIKFVEVSSSAFNDSITVTDDYASVGTSDDLTHQFSDSGTWNYSRIFTSSQAGVYVNTASAPLTKNGELITISDSATVTVQAVNSAPDAVDDTTTTNEDTAVDISVLANDSDPDGDTLTVTDVTTPAHGTTGINADKTVKYTPNAGWSGIDTFTYTISDGKGGSDTATVTVTVNHKNLAPDAVNDIATTTEDSIVDINVLANDTDPEGDILVVTGVTQPAHGAAAVNPDYTVKYTPNANWHGTDTFTYSISDGNGGVDSATVTVNVKSVNDKPVAIDDVAITNEDTSININVLKNDFDADGDTLKVKKVTQPSHGSASINADGTVKYKPWSNWSGIDTFTYTISDGNGGEDTAKVTVTVVAANDKPVALDDFMITNEDVAVNIKVLLNDFDIDGDVLSVISATTPSHGTATINANNTVKYTPDANWHGTDSFKYTISDGKGGSDTAKVTVIVCSKNDAPDAVDDAITTDEDTSVNIIVLANDTDVDGDQLKVIDASAPANGGVVINADGTITYTPNANYNGTDTFTYTISDGHGGIDSANVTVTINAINDAPEAQDDAAETDEDVAVDIDVLANDTDIDGDELAVSDISTPQHGAAVLNADGTIKYTPEADWYGTDTFTYEATDSSQATATATVIVTVNPINDAPVAMDDSAQTDEDIAVDIDVLSNDTDVDGDTLSVISVDIPAHGQAVINADGSITYTPQSGWSGTETFDYTISDGNGGEDSATVTVMVNAVNEAPIADDSSITTLENTAISGKVTGSDADEDVLTFKLDKEAEHGKVVFNSNGTYTYTPNKDYYGKDSFTFIANDGELDSQPATVSITVTEVKVIIPVTGEDTPYGLYGFAALMILAGACLLILRHKKQTK